MRGGGGGGEGGERRGGGDRKATRETEDALGQIEWNAETQGQVGPADQRQACSDVYRRTAATPPVLRVWWTNPIAQFVRSAICAHVRATVSIAIVSFSVAL